MDIREEHTEDTVILRVKWRSGFLQWDQGILTKTVRNLAARGQERVLLDVSEIPHFDSAAIAELVQCMAIVGRRGGTLELVNLHERIREDLSAANLLEVLSSEEND